MVSLDVWSDIACPWCFVGKRRLAAGARQANVPVDITWHAFELQPEMPAAGMPAHEFYARRFGSRERMQQLFAQMTATGAADGITFAFDRIARAPNTRLAHRVIRLARELGGAPVQDAVVEACFMAHFCNGIDVSDRDALLGALTGTGVEIATLRERLDADAALTEVIVDEEMAQEIGIGGVPFFIANGKLAVSGAQPPDVMASFLVKAAELGGRPFAAHSAS